MAKLKDTISNAGKAVTQATRPNSLAGLMEEQIFHPETYDAVRASSYNRASQVVANINYDYADEDEKKKYRNAIQQMNVDTDYFHRRGYLDTNSALQTHKFLDAAEQGVKNIRYNTYDEWGQGTANKGYVGELQSQLDSLQKQLSTVQQNSLKQKSGFDMLSYLDSNAKPLEEQIDLVKGKLKNVNVQFNDPNVSYYENRTTEQLLKDKQTIEEAIARTNDYESAEGQTGTLTPMGKNAYDNARMNQQNYLNIVNRILGEREREDKYNEYLSVMDSENFDGYYDPTVDKNDIFYQAVNGKWKGEDTYGSALFYEQSQFDEMTNAERQIYNSIYKNEGSTAAMEFFEFLQRDLNFRNRVNTEAAAREFAKENPVMASVTSSILKLGSPMTAINQLANAFSEGGIDQNASYNLSSYVATALRDQVSRDIRNVGGESKAWMYNIGMSVADNVLQMAASGGSQNAILALMSSSVFADSVVQMKDAGKSDTEIIATSTARALIEFATEKIGLDNVFKFAEQGGLKNLLTSILAEGGEEGLSNVGNLLYDTIASALTGKTSELENDVKKYKALGWSDSEAIGQVFSDRAKELGLDIAGGALSGFMLSGAAYVGKNGINISKNMATTTLDYQIEKGSHQNSDSLAYKYSEVFDKNKSWLGRQAQKLAITTLNEIEDTKFSYAVEGYREQLRNTPAEELEDTFDNLRDSAKSERDQLALFYALDSVYQDLDAEQIRKTNPTIDTADEADIVSIERFGEQATARTKSGEIVAIENINWKSDDSRIAMENAIKDGGYGTYQVDEDGKVVMREIRGFKKTSDANDYLAAWKMTEGKANPTSFDNFYKTAYKESTQFESEEKIRAMKEVTGFIEYAESKGIDVNKILEMAMKDGRAAAYTTTEGQQANIKKIAEKFKVEVEFADGLWDAEGNRVQGYYDPKTKKIYISTTTTNPATMVFCHELTHAMKDLHPNEYKAYSDMVLSKLAEKSNYRNQRDEVARLYGYDRSTFNAEIEEQINDELVAIASENYLIDKNFVESVKENKEVFRVLRNTILSEYRKGMGDSFRNNMIRTTAEDQEWFEKAAKIWIDTATGEESTEAEYEDMKREIIPEGERQFSREMSFSDQVDSVLNGTHNPRYDLYVSETPQYLIDLNFTDGAVLMRNGKIQEILDKHPEMDKELIKKIPEIIEDPILALKSRTHPEESVVLIGDVQTAKGEMIVPVWVNQEGVYIDVELGEVQTKTNFAASGYGREVRSLINYAVNNKGVVYQSPDINRVTQLLTRNGLQLSTPLELSDSVIKIPQNGEESKYSRSFDDYMDLAKDPEANEDVLQEMVDEAAERAGWKPAHMYHGSLKHGFREFDKEKAQVGGNSGAGFYFTNDRYDAGDHYEDIEGADNFFKADHLADQIIDAGEWNGEIVTDYDRALEIAKDELNTSPGTYDVYLKYENPYVRDYKNSTNIYYQIMDEFDSDDYVDRDDYDSDDDYEDALMDARDEHLYTEISRAVREAYNQLEENYEVIDAPSVYDLSLKILEHAYDYDKIDWDSIQAVFANNYYDVGLLNDNMTEAAYGESEYVRAIIEAFGYDAIEDYEVSSKFGQLSREMATDTYHTIVFSPEQIKSAEPVTYDENGDIIPLEERFDITKKDLNYSRDFGYHAGDLGKAESLFNQSGSRDTGHFGTGTYFVGNEERIDGYNSRNGEEAPVETVDFSQYNLFKPNNYKDADTLHEFFRYVDGRYGAYEGARSASEYNNLKEQLYDLYSEFEDNGTLDTQDEIDAYFFEDFEPEERRSNDEIIDEVVSVANRAIGKYALADVILKHSNDNLSASDGELSLDEWETTITPAEYLKSLPHDEAENIIGWIETEASDWRSNGLRNAERYESWHGKFNDVANILGVSEETLENTITEATEEADQIDYPDSRTADSIATRVMKKLGYEGIDVRHINEMDNTTYGSVIYDLKGEDLARKQEIGTARYSRSFDEVGKFVPTFYSKLARTVDAFKGDKIGAGSLVSYLKGKGIKDEEIKWSGIETFLEGKKSVTKQEVSDYLKDNTLEIREHIRTDRNSQLHEIAHELYNDYGINPYDYDDYFEMVEMAEEWLNNGEITQGAFDEINRLAEDFGRERGYNNTQWSRYSTLGGDNYREITYSIPGAKYYNQAMRVHWGQFGVVAHARIQDFTTIDDEDVLFVEEIQSDWHNAGQQFGYFDSEDDSYQARDKMRGDAHQVRREYEDLRMELEDRVDASDYAKPGWQIITHYLDLDDKSWKEVSDMFTQMYTKSEPNPEKLSITNDVTRLRQLRDKFINLERKAKDFQYVPDAPFKNGRYIEYVLKDLLRKAAQEGKSYLAWTPAEMQVARWSDEYAEGYRIEYDQDIPKFLNKYGKQWGATVKEITMAAIDVKPDYAYDYDFADYHLVPAIEITDKMRESLLYEGQPMFSRAFESKADNDELLDEVADVLSQVKNPDVKLTDEQKMNIAKSVKWGTGSEYSTEELAQNLERAFAYWSEHKNLDYKALTQVMRDIMMPVVNEIYDYSGDMRRRLLLRNKTFIISRATADAFGGIKALNQQVLKYGVAFSANENHAPESNARQVLKLVDNWSNDFEGVAYDFALDPTITDEKEMVQAMLNFMTTEKKNSRVKLVPDEFAEAYAGDLALKAYEEFVKESKIDRDDVNRKARKYAKAESLNIIRSMAEIREKYEARYLDMMARGVEEIKQQKDQIKENADKAHYFDMLKREMRTLEKLTTNPTRTRHIGFDYVKYLKDIADMVDITSNRKFSKTNNKLRELAEEYKRIASQDKYLNTKDDPTIYGYILETADMVDGRAIRELSSSEIKRVYDCIRAFVKAATTQDTFIGMNGEDIDTAAKKTIADVRGAKGVGTSGAATVFDSWLTKSLNPEREIERLVDFHEDDPFLLSFNELSKGEVNVMRYQMEMAQIFSDMDRSQFKKGTKEYDRAKELRSRYDKLNDRFEKVTLGGQEVNITEGQKLALIMHNRNGDNMRHILNGGILVPNEELYKKGKYSEAYNRGEIIVPKIDEIVTLDQNTDEFENWFLDRVIYYYEHYSKNLINETSLKLEGFSRAEVANYYPIRVAEDWLNTQKYDVTTGTEDSGDDIHSGMLIARKKSTLPIYLNSITQDLNRSQNFVARYAGLAIPLRDFQKIYNMNVDDGTSDGLPLKRVIKQKWGDHAGNYIDNMLKDLTKGRDNFAQTWLDQLRGKSAQGVLTINLSVSIKQAASYPTAIAELDWKSVSRAFINPEGNAFVIKRADMKEIQKWSPILWSRMAGMSTQEVAELAMKQNKDIVSKGMDKVPWLCDWIRKVDVATVGRLWYATKYWMNDQIQKGNVKLKEGSDEYFRAVADKFEDVVRKTQPNYTVLTRPDILRTKNSIVRALMMFKTQPLQNFGILYEASARFDALNRQYKAAVGTESEGAAFAARRQAGLALGRAITSQIVQTVVFTSMTLLANVILHKWNRYKDKDINEVTVASVFTQMGWDFASSLFGNAMFGDYVEQLGEYFVRKFALNQNDASLDGISVFGIDNLNDIWEETKTVVNKFSSGKVKDGFKRVEKLSFKLGQLFGVPAQNIYNIAHAGYETILDIAQNREITDIPGTSAKHYWERMERSYKGTYYDKSKSYEDIFGEAVKDVGADKMRGVLAKDDTTGAMDWVSNMYVNGTSEQKDMVEDWLDSLYSRDQDIKRKKKAFFEFQKETVPTEYLSKSEKEELGIDVEAEEKKSKEEKKQSQYDEWSPVTDQAFNDFLNGKSVSLPYKKGDDGVSDQLARLYQTSGNPQAVKQFAVQVLGYSASSIDWTANRYWNKDLSVFN